MQKIAIIGGGIVGSTAAYYLSKGGFENFEVSLFDEGIGQATKAAAGIISPWLSKRRNLKWYKLASDGANLLSNLAQETKMDNNTYANNGTIITRKNRTSLDELYKLALKRKKSNPQIGEINYISKNEIKKMIPIITNSPYDGLFVPRGSRIDGNLYCKHLLKIAKKRNLSLYQGRVKLLNDNQILYDGNVYNFDKIILATGAWSKEILADLNINLNLRPQKGQLIELKIPQNEKVQNMPVMMPESEYDFIPLDSGKLIVGATHDNEQGFDLKSEHSVDLSLVKTANNLINNITIDDIILSKVGTRAYTDDFGPFLGEIPGHSSLLIGTGLGSSGLTTGPMVAKLLVDLIKNKKIDLDQYQKPISTYIN